jgi:hypothetical protein
VAWMAEHEQSRSVSEAGGTCGVDLVSGNAETWKVLYNAATHTVLLLSRPACHSLQSILSGSILLLAP